MCDVISGLGGLMYLTPSQLILHGNSYSDTELMLLRQQLLDAQQRYRMVYEAIKPAKQYNSDEYEQDEGQNPSFSAEI